ncbi:MAG: hypothetical protein AAGU26_10385 [bacterium]
MKRMAVLLFIVFSIFSLSAETLSGFWGIPWGTPIAEIETTMAGKGYQASAKASNGYIYRNVSFAGRNGDAFFVLKDSRLVGGSFKFSPKRNAAYENYNSLKNDLISKYGTPTNEQEVYSSPYRKGDGYTETAIALNKLKLSAAWEFENNNLILLNVESDQENYTITIFLNYYTGVVMEETKKSVMDDL